MHWFPGPPLVVSNGKSIIPGFKCSRGALPGVRYPCSCGIPNGKTWTVGGYHRVTSPTHCCQDMKATCFNRMQRKWKAQQQRRTQRTQPTRNESESPPTTTQNSNDQAKADAKADKNNHDDPTTTKVRKQRMAQQRRNYNCLRTFRTFCRTRSGFPRIKIYRAVGSSLILWRICWAVRLPECRQTFEWGGRCPPVARVSWSETKVIVVNISRFQAGLMGHGVVPHVVLNLFYSPSITRPLPKAFVSLQNVTGCLPAVWASSSKWLLEEGSDYDLLLFRENRQVSTGVPVSGGGPATRRFTSRIVLVFVFLLGGHRLRHDVADQRIGLCRPTSMNLGQAISVCRCLSVRPLLVH